MKPSMLEHALLGLLRQQPQSGYDLRKTFASTPMRHFSDSPGSIYPALRRMQARGWVRASAESGNARQRRIFAVTATGTRVQIQWLRRPITRDDIIWGLDELMLRFAFLDGNVERPEALKFLQSFEQALAPYLDELSDFEKTFDARFRRSTGFHAFRCGVESYRAHLRWLRGVRKEFMEVSS